MISLDRNGKAVILINGFLKLQVYSLRGCLR